VVFLAIHKSVWKVDPVFQKMLADPFFDPVVLVCPCTAYGDERMWEDMQETLAYFNEKDYPTYSSYNIEDARWIKLNELSPDIVFFTNPHDLTIQEYYEEAYLNYLSCYVPYFILTTTHDGDQSIYNQSFHNSMWKIFMPHKFSMDRAMCLSPAKGRNCQLTGYPACEVLLKKNITPVWKKQDKENKRIIFSPHHTINETGLRLSNFLEVAEIVVSYANKYKEDIQWSFKPHPFLKSKLYEHALWGKNKTDKYYDYWRDQAYTQYDDGEYADLFLGSDAIIHDSGSFIAEYLFVLKPCAYIVMNGEAQLSSINDFGKFALEAYFKIKNIQELENFIVGVQNGSIGIKNKHEYFNDSYIKPLYGSAKPSNKIIDILKTNLLKEN
jgi:hypothetical protein